MSLETREVKFFWRDIPGFCRDIPEVPEKLEKKSLRSVFWPLNKRRHGSSHLARGWIHLLLNLGGVEELLFGSDVFPNHCLRVWSNERGSLSTFLCRWRS